MHVHDFSSSRSPTAGSAGETELTHMQGKKLKYLNENNIKSCVTHLTKC